MYKIFSVDDHIIEPPDVWTSRLPSKYVEEGPHVVDDGRDEYWVYEGTRHTTLGLNAVAGKPRDQWDNEPTRYSDMIPGCYDPKERSKDLLSQGVLASINFPTLPRFGGMLFPHFKDKVLADLCVKAWNDYVLDEWCPGGPEGLFVPMTICQVWDPDLAVKEIERCVAKGARALCFPENPVPDGLPSFHSDFWDPIWSTVEAAKMPVCMHIGSSGFIPSIDPAAPFSSIVSAGDVVCRLAMVNLMMSQVPLKFPDINIVWSEGGIGWIPALLERLDRAIVRQAGWAGEGLLASDIFARNMYACMIEEPVGVTFYEHIGADRILSECDYPHSDSPFPDMQEQYHKVVDGLPAEVIEMISHTNAEKLFDWKMASAELATVAV